MTLPTDPAKRTALLAVGGLVAALMVVLLVLGPQRTELHGMGLARLLQEEHQWRQQLWLEGSHINELELWQIQETLAVRANISTAGLKGLVRRAVNAKDASYRADGHLLAGNAAVAAVLAGQIAAWYEGKKGGELERARWLRRRGDALWRGNLEDPSPVLNQALTAAGERDPELRAALLKDLASWHWHRALFRPEDPAAEMAQGLAAVGSLLEQASALSRAEQVAAWHLQGRLLLRQACLKPERDNTLLEQATLAFENAMEPMDDNTRDELWAAIQHDLGVALLERGDWSGAARHLALALEVRDGKINTGGRVDVRVIERRLNERLRTLAFLALAEARGANGDAGARESARRHVDSVLGMTLPEDGGVPWITAQAALLQMARAKGDSASAAALSAAALSAAALSAAAREHYPHDQAGEPGLPLPGFFD